MTSLVAKGTYSGFDTGHAEVPVEIFAKAPNQRAWIVHMFNGDSYRVFDGRNGWFAGPDSPAPIVHAGQRQPRSRPGRGGDGVSRRHQEAYKEWRVGRTTIDDRDVSIVQGTTPGLLPVNFYFDNNTGLLVRMVRWNETPVGPVPTEINYDDYRDVAGDQDAVYLDGQPDLHADDDQVERNPAERAGRRGAVRSAAPRQSEAVAWYACPRHS